MPTCAILTYISKDCLMCAQFRSSLETSIQGFMLAGYYPSSAHNEWVLVVLSANLHVCKGLQEQSNLLNVKGNDYQQFILKSISSMDQHSVFWNFEAFVLYSILSWCHGLTSYVIWWLHAHFSLEYGNIASMSWYVCCTV